LGILQGDSVVHVGLRISEVAHLQLADLYLDEDLPRLVAYGKGSKERSVYLSPQAKRVLRDYLAERPLAVSNYVFLSYQLDGMSTTAIHKRLMRYREQSGVYLTAHRLRHTFGRPFGRLVNSSLDETCYQERVSSPWRLREPNISGLVSFQGT
jgi:integrase